MMQWILQHALRHRRLLLPSQPAASVQLNQTVSATFLRNASPHDSPVVATACCMAAEWPPCSGSATSPSCPSSRHPPADSRQHCKPILLDCKFAGPCSRLMFDQDLILHRDVQGMCTI
jgi:hypothetical protein